MSSHGGGAAIRYSQYASGGGGAAGPQHQHQQQQQHVASSNGGGGKPPPATQHTASATPPHVTSLPFMRPPMVVTSSGASMLPPQPPPSSSSSSSSCPQTPPGNGGLPKYPGSPIGSLSGSDTDVSTSNENLSREERYVLSHARVEPQGEENLQGSVTPVNEMQGRFIGDKFSSATSSDSTRYATPSTGSSRSISESRTGGGLLYANVGSGGGVSAEGVASNRSSMVGTGGGGSNRNSLKEPNSNRSSMDVSQSSYNTLIIHDDGHGGGGGGGGGGRDYDASSPPPYMMGKKERPRSYGEAAATVTGPNVGHVGIPMQDITELTEDYINRSHVLKHLAKEVKLARGSMARGHEGGTTPVDNNNGSGGRHWGSGGRTQQQQQQQQEEEPKSAGSKSYQKNPASRRGSDSGGGGGGGGGNGKLKSKSQPDLSRLYEIDPDEVDAIVKENHLLKQQLNNCYLKVAKSQKLEQEIANIYRVHEELVQSCDRRERLERAARTRLQQDCRRLQELNRAFRDQVEVYQSQLHASSDHQLGRTQQDVLISQLVNQNKSLVDANRRQCIELQAQNATLEEQRIHINVLDTALKRLEEECRQKQVYVERCAQLQHALQSLQNASERREQAERKLRLDYDGSSELPNRSGSSSSTTASETDALKWQLREKDAQILRLESECAKLEQRNLEESNVRNVAKLTMERNSQETERILAEAKQEKIRYLDEAHAANRKVTELQTRLKLVENRLAEKDAMIRAYQGQKIYGGSTNSYGSYNLSTDSFALNPLGAVYNSQPSYVDVSSANNAFDVVSGGGNGAGSLLDPSSVVVGPYGANVTAAAVAAVAAAAVSSYASTYGQTASSSASSSSFVQSSLALPAGGGGGGVASPGSSTASNYSSSNFGAGGLVGGGGSSSEHTIYDSKNFDAQRKSIDDQLKQLDEQLLSKRGLCCFPSLTTKKPIQSLLADEVSVLSANNSEAFLQNLAHIGSSDRRSEPVPAVERGDGALAGGSNQKAEDMVLLEKQGRCSQKLRGGSSSAGATLGNLAHVSQAVGQNMTDISNIGATTGGGGGSGGGSNASGGASGNKMPKMPPQATGGGLLGSHKVSSSGDHRGSSLPPSALPRPPRSLKPPRKIEYGRLSDVGDVGGGMGGGIGGKKTRAATPPSPASSSGTSREKDAFGGGSGGSLKRSVVGGRDFSPAKGAGCGGYVEMKDTVQLTKEYGGGTLKHNKTYGSMTTVAQGGGTKFGFGGSTSGKCGSPSVGGGGGGAGGGTSGSPDYPSTRNYQRLEESSSPAAQHRHNNSGSLSSSQSRKSSADSGTLKRSLLPNVSCRKLPSPKGGGGGGGGSRDSLNSASSGSNNSNNPTAAVTLSRSSPQPPASAATGYPNHLQHHHQHQHQHQHHHHQYQHQRTPPRFLHQHQPSTSIESNKSHSGYGTIQQQQQQQQLHQGFFAKFPSSPSASPARLTMPPHHPPKGSSSLPSSSILHAAATSSATSAIGQTSTASLPPKPSLLLDKSSGGLLMGAGSGSSGSNGQQRRGSSLARNENKYRIQF